MYAVAAGIQRSADPNPIRALADPGEDPYAGDMHEHSDRQATFDHANFDWNQAYQGDTSDYQVPDPQILKIIDSLPPGRALDVGCGAGGLLVALAQRGWRVTGIDIASNAIAAARQVLTAHSVDADLQVADATVWQPDECYDLITHSFAIPPAQPGRAAVFAMMRAAVAPGGHVAITDLDTSMARYGFFTADQLVTVDQLKAAFDGFDILRAEIVDTPTHDHDGQGTHADERWTAALLHARKPVDDTDRGTDG